MSQASSENDFENDPSHEESPPRGLWLGIGLLAAFLLVGLIVMQFVLNPPASNELALQGGVQIDVEPGTKVFVGDKLIGTGPVKVSWDEILGTADIQPLALPLDPQAPPPAMDSMGGVTAGSLVGTGSTILWSEKSMSGTLQMVEPLRYAFKDVLLRRRGGRLDHLFVVDGQFTARDGKWQRFLIPIRLRSAQADAEPYFAKPGSTGAGAKSGFTLPGTRVGEKLWLSIQFRRGSAPEPFADEIQDKGLWRPPGS